MKISFKNFNSGFTLIEVIIYIALFSLLMGSAFIIAFQLIQGSGNLSTKNTVQEEGNFVLRKLNWELTGFKSITTPSSGTTNNLIIINSNGDQIEFCLDSEKIKIHEGAFGSCNDLNYLPLTTDNVQVTKLEFTKVGSGTTGISVLFSMKTLNTAPLDFNITKYIRK